jgi:hypothetical protein
MMKRKLRIAAGALLLAAVVGFMFASPEPVRIVRNADGSATADPRIPWAAALTELSFVVGLGLLVVSLVLKDRMKVSVSRATG